MNTLRITIDTNVLIYLFDPEAGDANVIDSSKILRAILENQQHVLFDTQISTTSEDDLLQDTDITRRKAILLRIRNIFQQVSPGEFLIDEKGETKPKCGEDEILFRELQRILFPSLDVSSNSYLNNINDIKHLFSHIKNKRDIYVTNDKNFLKETKIDALKVLNAQVMSPKHFVDYINSYSDKDTYEYKSAPVRHDYRNLALKGTGKMDFTNNNGLFVIGNGDFIFEIKWGECSHEKMRVYNDPRTIESIALAEDKKIKEILSEKFYDFTDRCREPRRIKDILILKNSKGYYAAVKIIDFKVKDRGDETNFLEFEYVINTTGDCNFKESNKTNVE